MNASPISGRRLLVAIATSVGLAVAAGSSTAYGLPILAPSWGDTDRLAAVIVLEVYIAIIVGHLIAFGGLKGFPNELRIVPTSRVELLCAAAVWVGMWTAAAIVYLGLSQFAWSLSEVRSALLWIGADGGRLGPAEPLLFVVAGGRAVFVAPFAEELLFRGSLFGWMRRRWPASATIFVTSALFALGHPMAVLWPAAFMLGVGAAWFRERSGSLTPFIVMHAVNNIALTTISYFATGWDVPNLLAG